MKDIALCPRHVAGTCLSVVGGRRMGKRSMKHIFMYQSVHIRHSVGERGRCCQARHTGMSRFVA